MEFKHTPGPWTNHGRIPQPGLPHSSIGAKTLLARVYSEAFGDIEQETANAHLIAAAPDLLAAAQWARDAMRQAFDEVLQTIPEGGVVPPWMATLETTIVDAEHAIAKATGGQG